jgi:hypothetical protein
MRLNSLAKINLRLESVEQASERRNRMERIYTSANEEERKKEAQKRTIPTTLIMMKRN